MFDDVKKQKIAKVIDCSSEMLTNILKLINKPDNVLGKSAADRCSVSREKLFKYSSLPSLVVVIEDM